MIQRTYCKINLGLSIINKREDGFHNLETIFVPCKEIFDVIEINESSQFSLTVFNADFEVKPEDNLCTKAFRLLAQAYSIPDIEIKLSKNIPSGAGVGGGSGNAAAVLMMLNEMFSLQISEEQMAHYALQLGSDVPFFLKNSNMFATGRGEILTPCPIDLSHTKIEMACPKVHISTKEAFSNIIIKDNRNDLQQAILAPKNEWKNLIFNDFEPYAFAKFPELKKMKENFYNRGAYYAAMSGSGSAIFGLFEQ